MEITRSNFARAIVAGIFYAKGEVTEAEADRLSHVARNATEFGTNFAADGREGVLNCGCPASQAGLREWYRLLFAYGFDDAMRRIIDPVQGSRAYASQSRIKVVG